MRRNRIFNAVIFLMMASAPAMAQGYTGYSSANPPAAQPAPQAQTPPLQAQQQIPGLNQYVQHQQAEPQPMPGTQPVGIPDPSAVPPAAQPAVPAAAPVPPSKPDPCAAYAANYDYYTICQDRLQKIQRMQDAKTKRTPVAPVAAPATPAAAPAATAPATPAAAPAAGTASTPATESKTLEKKNGFIFK